MAKSRSIKYTANSLVAILSVLAILSFLNFITNRHRGRIDTTETSRFSLSDQTTKVLAGLDKEVKAYAFFQGVDMRMEDLLGDYAYRSDKFTFEFVDPDKKPELAKVYNVDQYSTIILVSGDRDERVEENTEQGITNTILKVSRDEKKKIYFLEGHGERDLENIEREGFSLVKEAIEDQNYAVERLNLAAEDSIPAQCAAIVVASPKVKLFDRELELIQEYLDGGGSLLVLLDPDPAESLEGFLATWGVKVGHDLVVDASGVGRLFGVGPTMPLISTYESHPITEGFKVMTFFPNCRSVDIATDQPQTVRVTSLCKTTKNSWAETKAEGTMYEFDEEDDTRGPVSIAVAVTKDVKTPPPTAPAEGQEATESSRMVVFGDADFASNSYFHASGNSDLFMNSLSWLVEEEDLISIRPREADDRRLTLTAGQTKAIFYLSIVVMPLAIVAIGIFVWSRKR